jgi:hypothetical protein
MLGQTMDRVRAAAASTGSLAFETDATEVGQMWAENETLLENAIQRGYRIFDIGRDAARADPGYFHPKEELFLASRGLHAVHAGWVFVRGELTEVFEWVGK